MPSYMRYLEFRFQKGRLLTHVRCSHYWPWLSLLFIQEFVRQPFMKHKVVNYGAKRSIQTLALSCVRTVEGPLSCYSVCPTQLEVPRDEEPPLNVTSTQLVYFG